MHRSASTIIDETHFSSLAFDHVHRVFGLHFLRARAQIISNHSIDMLYICCFPSRMRALTFLIEDIFMALPLSNSIYRRGFSIE